MIYTVELNFSDPARADEWNAWYETYLAQLVSLPGLSTAQRFRAVTPGAQPWDYLALYSLASLDVFESDAYRYADCARCDWRRNVYGIASRTDGRSCYVKMRRTDSIWTIVYSCPWRQRRGDGKPAPPSSMAIQQDARWPSSEPKPQIRTA